MNIFPKSHEQFIIWSSNIASSLNESSKGQLRVGHNKLAATMAKALPGVGNNFNINTLKSMFDEANSPLERSIEKIAVTSESSEILACLKIDISHAVYEWMEQIVDALAQGNTLSLFDSLNHDGSISDFYSDFNDITDETFSIANTYFSEHETELLDDTYASWSSANAPFNIIQRKTVGYAYRTYLLDAVCSFFNELASYYYYYSQSNFFKKLNKEQLTKWVSYSFDLWSDTEGVPVPKNAQCFSHAISKVLGPRKYEYDVVVRAIVTGSKETLEDWIVPSPWECYDFSTRKDGDLDSLLRADCIVKVIASNADDAIEKAISAAPGLEFPLYSSVNVELWVDYEQSSDVKQGDMQPHL